LIGRHYVYYWEAAFNGREVLQAVPARPCGKVRWKEGRAFGCKD